LNIRNFSIIAHIDHGKSTLADRFLETTGAVNIQNENAQFLDSMELERERGITIKAKTARMQWRGHVLNLIDTPGHVDFTFEVHRALWACEGVLLLVDASQGVQAQTVANYRLAQQANLKVIPVINKVDLSNALVEQAEEQIQDILQIDAAPFKVSAKLGWGVEELLDAIVAQVPPPSLSQGAFRALMFDSYFDSFQGVVLFIRVFDGEIRPGNKIRFYHEGSQKAYLVEEVGYLTPKRQMAESLASGMVGYLICGIRDPRGIRHGETLVLAQDATVTPLRPLGTPLKPFVYVGIYPISAGEVEELRNAFNKLHLTDPSFDYAPESSIALGPGFRCGFFGLLHLEIVTERLRREFGLDIIITNPHVLYRVHTRKGEIREVANPAAFPEHGNVKLVEEPYALVKILTPVEFVGIILELLKSRRGIHKELTHLSPTVVQALWEVPLAEMVVDFYDKLKSISRGYASMDYELSDYKSRDKLVKVEILVHSEPCDALAFVTSRDSAYDESLKVLERLKTVIPRQMFEINLQAVIEGKIIAKEKIAGIRKDVLAKCYGGDISRKMKLLKKQKEGKKRMRMIGRVEIPAGAFAAVLKR